MLHVSQCVTVDECGGVCLWGSVCSICLDRSMCHSVCGSGCVWWYVMVCGLWVGVVVCSMCLGRHMCHSVCDRG